MLDIYRKVCYEWFPRDRRSTHNTNGFRMFSGCWCFLPTIVNGSHRRNHFSCYMNNKTNQAEIRNKTNQAQNQKETNEAEKDFLKVPCAYRGHRAQAPSAAAPGNNARSQRAACAHSARTVRTHRARAVRVRRVRTVRAHRACTVRAHRARTVTPCDIGTPVSCSTPDW